MPPALRRSKPSDIVGERSSAGSDPLAYITRAEQLRRAGHLARALSVCMEGLERGPRSAAGHIELGKIYLDMGKYGQTESVCEQVLAESPQSVGARKLLVEIALRRTQYVRALSLLEDLLADSPEDPDLVGALAEAQQGMAQRFRHIMAQWGPVAKTSPAACAEGGSLEALVARLGQRSEVIACGVIECGTECPSNPWAEMLAQWGQACQSTQTGALRGARLSPVKTALIESPSHTIFLHTVKPNNETASNGRYLVVVIPATASIGPIKMIAESILASPR